MFPVRIKLLSFLSECPFCSGASVLPQKLLRGSRFWPIKQTVVQRRDATTTTTHRKSREDSPTKSLRLKWKSKSDKQLIGMPIFYGTPYQICIIDSSDSFDKYFKNMTSEIERFGVLTFDTESQTYLTKTVTTRGNINVDMIQIGTLCGKAYLFRVHRIGAADLYKLTKFLSSQHIKLGCGILGDLSLLQKDFSITMPNSVDVSDALSHLLSPIDVKLLRKGRPDSDQLGLKNTIIPFIIGGTPTKVDWKMFTQVNATLLPKQLVEYAADDVISLVDIYWNLYAYTQSMKLKTRREIQTFNEIAAGHTQFKQRLIQVNFMTRTSNEQ